MQFALRHPSAYVRGLLRTKKRVSGFPACSPPPYALAATWSTTMSATWLTEIVVMTSSDQYAFHGGSVAAGFSGRVASQVTRVEVSV